MPKTLLLADDSVVIQKLVGLSFANEDVELLTADNGDDAIALASAHHPDVVIADVIMPGKSGYEVCEAIKADPSLAATPVLLLTGTFEAFDAERAQAVGAAGHITKPFEAQALVDRVKDLFANPAPAPAASKPALEAEPIDATRIEMPFLESETASDSAFDFFEDDVSDLSNVELAADPLDDPFGAVAGSATPHVPADLDAGLLGSDSTVALMPDETVERGDELPESLVELEPEPELQDGSATVLAEDLFDSPSDDDSDWLAPPPHHGPAGAEAVVTDLESEMDDDSLPAIDATVLTDDLFDSVPSDTVLEAEPEATWAEPVTPRIEFNPPASDFDISDSDLGPPLGSDDADEISGPALNLQAPSRGLESGTSASATDAVTSAIQERLHETLEKVAWEAFSELSEQVVRQVLERVETIAWEVIPQMTETMIREEIRRMKGEDDS